MLGLAIGVRMLLLDTSTHFLSDESRDLVNIHQIWVEKQITLVGPISDDRSHVFSSLTYYMLLPFAVILNFDPLGSVIGAVFWGILTWGLVVYLGYKTNPKWMLWIMILASVWWPMVETARWPWNPNLMLFWLFLGLVTSNFLSGMSLGLAVHHHYLALVPGFLTIIKRKSIWGGLGLVVALSVFVIFDLLHPPGIFVGKMISYNQNQMGQNILKTLLKLPDVLNFFGQYIFGHKQIAMVGLVLILLLAIWDVINQHRARSWLVIWFLTLLPLVFYSTQSHYLLPAVPVFAMWLFSTRQGWGSRWAKVTLVLLIAGSMTALPKHYQQPDWMGNLKLMRGATRIIREQIISQQLKNPNLAVLSSPDIYPSGKKYRDLLLVNEIRIKPYEEYETSDNLFVITKGEEKTLREDPAAEIMYFRDGPVTGVWEIPETNWRVIQFNRY